MGTVLVTLVAQTFILVTLAARIVVFGVLLSHSNSQLTGMAVLHSRSSTVTHKQSLWKQFNQLVGAVALDQTQVAYSDRGVVVGSQTGETCKDELS